MKQLTKIFMLAVLVVFASCQENETIEDLSQENQEALLRFSADGNVIGDGEEDKELVFTADSETLASPSFTMATMTNSSVGVSAEIDALTATLPSSVTVSTTAKPGVDAYFDVTVDDASGVLSGSGLPAWCADQDLSLDSGETVDFDVYSSYGELPEGKFEKPENFDKVNWLLNQSIIGEHSPNGLGDYNFGHVQYAIWLLIDDSVCQVCTFLSDPIGDWNADGNDIAQAEELRDLALNSGAGYVPGVGEKLAVVLVPDGKQSIIIGVEIEALPCEDCQGKVTDLDLQWNWPNDYRVRVYQRYENTCYAVKIFDEVVGQNGEIDLSGVNHDGSIGKWAYVFVGNCYYTKFRTDCNLNIGPGYKRGVLEVTGGESSHGGELCEYEQPYHYCW